MLPILILYLFKKIKSNTVILSIKEELKTAVLKVKTFLFILAVLISFSFAKVNSKVITYHVIKNNVLIGTIEINKRVIDDSVIYLSESHIKVKFLLKFNVVAKEKSVYKDGVLVYSSIFRTVNKKTKTDNKIVLDNGQYKLQSTGNSTALGFNRIKQNLITLYFEEPNGAGYVFCDNLGTMSKITPLGDSRYKVEFSNGAYNVFHYKNGQCVKIDAVNKLFNVTLIPVVI